MRRELDDRILQQARAGDAGACRALYQHHAQLVFAFVQRMLRDHAAAEDVLQETFVRVFGALARFDAAGPARLSTWILTIGRNVALTTLAARRSPGDLPAPPREVAPMHDLRLGLEAAIASLPEAQRSVFVLRECCALSYEEVAAIEGLDLGTVKSRLHRARAALQAALADELDGTDEVHGPARATGA